MNIEQCWNATVPVSLCPPQISNRLACNQNHACAVRDLRLTARAVPLPLDTLRFELIYIYIYKLSSYRAVNTLRNSYTLKSQ
jgi:hypothetical protein